MWQDSIDFEFISKHELRIQTAFAGWGTFGVYIFTCETEVIRQPTFKGYCDRQ